MTALSIPDQSESPVFVTVTKSLIPNTELTPSMAIRACANSFLVFQPEAAEKLSETVAPEMTYFRALGLGVSSV